MKIDVSQFAKECSCRRKHNIFVKNIIIEQGAISTLAALLAEKPYCDYTEPTIICDENTWNAAEQSLCGSLSHLKRICLLSKNLHADEYAIAAVQKEMPQDAGLLIAIGSGTIHDITRFVAFEKGINFISVPTAASVDGFVSTVAAMTWGGLKKTFPAVSPICVVCDSGIFSKAPFRLTASGISDLLGKYIALADWKISNAVTGEYICEKVCKLEYEALEQVCACVEDLHKGKIEAYEQLMYALLLSGLAMQMIGNSRPASGAEHHISHLIEMEVVNDHIEAYHGEKVGCGLLIAIAAYKNIGSMLRSKTVEKSDYSGFEEDLLQKHFGAKGLYDGIIAENTPDPLEAVTFEKILINADKIADIIDELPCYNKIENLMGKAGCVRYLTEIGLENSIEKTLKELSPYVRGRLTFMRMIKLLK